MKSTIVEVKLIDGTENVSYLRVWAEQREHVFGPPMLVLLSFQKSERRPSGHRNNTEENTKKYVCITALFILTKK